MDSSERKWLEVWQVAKRLRVGNDSVYRWIKFGVRKGAQRIFLKAFRFSTRRGLGKREKISYRIADDELDRFIRACSM